MTLLKAMVIAAQAACLAAEVEARNAEAEARARALVIEQMKYTIAIKHEQFGQSSERSAVLEQLELQLVDMEEDASQAEAAAQMVANAASSCDPHAAGRCHPLSCICSSAHPRRRQYCAGAGQGQNAHGPIMELKAHSLESWS
jgi:Transposase C of IS166 homeodomain